MDAIKKKSLLAQRLEKGPNEADEQRRKDEEAAKGAKGAEERRTDDEEAKKSK